MSTTISRAHCARPQGLAALAGSVPKPFADLQERDDDCRLRAVADVEHPRATDAEILEAIAKLTERHPYSDGFRFFVIHRQVARMFGSNIRGLTPLSDLADAGRLYLSDDSGGWGLLEKDDYEVVEARERCRKRKEAELDRELDAIEDEIFRAAGGMLSLTALANSLPISLAKIAAKRGPL